MPRELRRQFCWRRANLGLPKRTNIFAARAEGRLQEPAVANERSTRAIGQEQGLVRVERDAVGLLDAAQQRLSLIAKRKEAAISAIDMQPGIVAAAEVRNLGERIDRAGVHGPRRSDDQPGAHTT